MSSSPTRNTLATNFDVLIIGAGISGIGAAYHLKTRRPGTSFAVLDSKNTIGGTWTQFKYPGIRSDSDMPTFGFGFQPWTDKKSIADAHIILDYLNKTISDHNLGEHIRFGRKVVSAEFFSAAARWTVTTERADNGETEVFTSRFFFSGTGYYNHDKGFTPEFEGTADFGGRIVHPQHWPDDLDYTGKKVVVIGSGATAVTLLPAMAAKASHVTMLQRSPSYVLSLPAEDAIANVLNKTIGPKRAHRIIRRKNVLLHRGIFKACKRFPQGMRKLLIANVARQLPKGYDVATHFTPRYNPWEQRLCMVPNGDLFAAIRSGDGSVVTDRIVRFTKTGLQLESGAHLDADIIVTATGLNLLPFGNMAISVDGRAVDFSETTVFKSMMISGLPNFVFALGYTNISWTLKVDLVCEHFVRMLDHMDSSGADVVVPVLQDAAMERLSLLDLSAGYVQRSIAAFPKAGTVGPWTVEMAYEADVARLRHGPVTDPELHFAAAAVLAA